MLESCERFMYYHVIINDGDIMKPKKCMLILAAVAILSLSLTHSACTIEDTQHGFGGCERCHPDVAANFTTSLHYTGAGMMDEYERGAAGHFGIDMDEYYSKWKCAGCHAVTCTKCHPGQNMYESHLYEVTIKTCEQCHAKKQTSTYVGDMPGHKSKGPNADVHYEYGLDCTDCHTASEIHGTGIEYDTQLAAVVVECEGCHKDVTESRSHTVHGDKIGCIACHTGWSLTCNGCHIDTRKGTKPTADEFYLGVDKDGQVTTFLKMEATIGNDTHTGYGAWYSHTITSTGKQCEFCHENEKVLLAGCEGQMLGEGGSLIPQATIDRIIGADITPPSGAKTIPGFAGLFVAVIIGIVYLTVRRRK